MGGLSDSVGASCSTIPGATSSTYTLQSSDVGQYLLATVTASNAGGSTPATSAVAGQVLPADPTDTTAPGITGTAQQGDTLTASTGVWTNNPTSFKYAWEDCTDSSGATCTTISGAASKTYALQAADVGKFVSVTVSAFNAGGLGSVTSAGVGPVLPPAPVNTQAPAITGKAEQGDTLSVSNGTWSNSPTGYSYAWEHCNSSGGSCSAIGGATSSSYALSAADVGGTIVCVVTATGLGGTVSASSNKTVVVIPSPIPAASQPTTTDLLATPSAPVTNQSVTLIATVTAGTSSTALWGTVSFANGGAAIAGCTNLPVAPRGQSATVACATSFTASTAQLRATFTPTAGSILKGSASALGSLAVGPDSSATSLNASASVEVGSSTTYTATVTPPAARPGPVQPTGSVEFLDGGQPIGTCAAQPVGSGQAACTVTYAAAGAHEVTAQYSGDGNFTGSSSPAQQVSAVPVQTSVLGTITSTMQWQFYFTPHYTMVRGLVINGVSSGATVLVKCHGRGCPFTSHSALLGTGTARCSKQATRMCFRAGSFTITPAFAGRQLVIGSRITVRIIQSGWVGKSYSFTVRARRGPRVQIGCLAPGATDPGLGC